MMDDLVCWQCGASIAALSLPLRRLEECGACSAELHVCRMCEFYDTAVAKSCREPIAEEVRDKIRANFCDYFRPRPGAFVSMTAQRDAAARQLDALFGDDAGEGPEPPSPRDDLEDLFRK